MFGAMKWSDPSEEDEDDQQNAFLPDEVWKFHVAPRCWEKMDIEGAKPYIGHSKFCGE